MAYQISGEMLDKARKQMGPVEKQPTSLKAEKIEYKAPVTKKPGLISRAKAKVVDYFKKESDIKKQATAEMNKRYPAGWAQSPTNVSEYRTVKRELRNKR